MSQAEVLGRILLEGDALLRAGRFAEGEERAQAVLARQPRNAGGHYLLGMSALMQQRHAEALAHVERAIRLDRVNARYHFMAALCLAPLARLEEAIAACRRALQFRPEFIEARANMGYLLELAGRFEEAIDAYRRVLATHPHEWNSLNRLGYCERIAGRAQAALEPLQRALALEPRSAPTHNELALAFLQLGRTAEAIASLRAAADADPGFVEAWANLAKLLYIRHLEAVRRAERGEAAHPDPAPVIECFDRLIAFDPSNVEFGYLRDCVAGVRVDRPPDRYIESFFDRFAAQFEDRLVGELAYRAPEAARRALEGGLGDRSGLAVADLGCGTGLFGEYLRSRAARLVGVDLSGAMLERARAHGHYDELVREEIGDWLQRVQPGSLDVAVALDVFIYVGRLERVFRACAAALAAGGVLVCSVEDAPDADDFVLRASGRYAHGRGYVGRMAEAAGFTLERADPFDIRVEAGEAVPAILYVLRKTA